MVETKPQIEPAFMSLPGTERTAIISLGAALRLSYLKKRLFLAENKLQQFGAQYGVSLAQLDAQGLPDDAGHTVHEDYLMWHHWAGVVDKLKPNLAALEEIVQQGLSLGELSHAGG